MSHTGNVLVIVVVLKNPKMRTTVNILLLNLAVTDIMTILAAVPTALYFIITKFRWLGLVPEALLPVMIYGNFAPAFASAYTFIPIAIERYVQYI